MSKVSKLDAHTGYLLRMVSNAVSQEFARRVAGEGVTVAEWVLLRSLHDGKPCAPSVLARILGMTKGAISKLSDRLLEKGLLERTENPEDKRAHRLSLSEKGAGKVPILAGLADANDAAFFSVLSAKEHGNLRDLLNLLITRHGLSAAPVD